MIVQGLGLNSIIEHRARAARTQARARVDTEPSSLFKTNDTYVSGEASERADLLASIRNKIKAGYYSTDNVLEDLSHGFAKALDQTL